MDLRTWRVKKGLSIVDAGKFLGISFVTISKIENGRCAPHKKTVNTIISGTGGAVDEFPVAKKRYRNSNESYRFAKTLDNIISSKANNVPMCYVHNKYSGCKEKNYLDFCILTPSRVSFIEFPNKKGSANNLQKQKIKDLEKLGYSCKVTKTIDGAIQALKHWGIISRDYKIETD